MLPLLILGALGPAVSGWSHPGVAGRGSPVSAPQHPLSVASGRPVPTAPGVGDEA